MKKYALLLLLGASALFYSCEPDDPQPVNTTPTKPTNTQPDTIPKSTRLMAKSWRLTGFTQSASGSSVYVDLYESGFPNCQKDDLYKFTAPNVLTVETGNAKCDQNEVAKQGTWELRSNNTVLSLNIPAQTITGLTGDFSVLEISASRIIVARVINSSQYTLMFSGQ
jgi:hypothetical protein